MIYENLKAEEKRISVKLYLVRETIKAYDKLFEGTAKDNIKLSRIQEVITAMERLK